MSLFDWPLLAMLLTAFGAATLLPFSSEVALVAALKSGTANGPALVVAATLGNVGGACFNWWIGRNVRRFEGRRWFPFNATTITKASERFRRFGSWSLLFSWLPIVGDPLTFVAGVLRVPLVAFLPLVAIGKGGRYLALALSL